MAQAIDPTASPFDRPPAGPNVSPISPPGGQAYNQVPMQNATANAGGTQTQGGGGQKKGGWVGNFHADDVINSQFTGLTDQQREYIRNQLANQGLSEHSPKADFIKGLSTLANSIPGLSSKSTANALFPDQAGGAGGGWDPLAMQMFTAQTLAPLLQGIQHQTQSIVDPLYKQAQAAVPGIAGGQSLHAMLAALQGSNANLQGAIGAATASAPSLDALMANVTAARQAAQRSFYESEKQSVYGGAGGTSGATDLASLLKGST